MQRSRRGTVLMVSPEWPFPMRNGGKIRTAQLLRQLAAQYQVTLVCYAPPDGGPAEAGPNVVVQAVPRPSRRQRLPILFQGLARGVPYHFAVQQSPALTQAVLAALPDSDLVIVEHLCMFPTIEAAERRGRCPVILDLHNVESYRAWNAVRRPAGWSLNPIDWLHWLATPAYERRALRQTSCCLVVSDEEGKRVQAMVPGTRVELIPNGVDTDYFGGQPAARPADRPPVMLFVGSLNYRPNVEAVIFFATRVLPRLRAVWPGVEFWAVGQKPASELRAAAERHHFQLFGDVADVRPFYAGCDVVVAPLFSGGGTRLKILEAMAMGKPIVSTTLGAEGLNLADRGGLTLADTTEAMASQCLAWIRAGKTAAAELARRQRQAVEKYAWATIGQQATAICEGLLAGRTAHQIALAERLSPPHTAGGAAGLEHQ